MRTPGIVVFSVLALVATSARGADATQELAAKRRPPSQAVVAKALAARVVAARTPAARYRALLGVMRALNLGVYTAKGKTALRGGRSAFHVYKFELKGLARVLPRDRTWTVAELARDLDAVGVRPGGKPLSGERLYAVLSGGVRAALRRPRGRFAVVPLLVRQLGLFRRPAQDLARPAAPGTARLDELQRFLVLADAAEAAAVERRRQARFLAAAGRGAAPLAEAKGAGSRGQPESATGPCSAGVDVKAVIKIGKWLVPLVKGLPNIVRAATALLDIGHASTMAVMIDIQPTRSGQVSDTHYGPAGNHPGFTEPHYPGQPLVFQVGVQSLIVNETKTDKLLLECWELAGLKLPTEGPVAGVPVNWNDLRLGDYDKLRKHGTIVREDPVTGPDGLAILVFQPKEEKVPGFGERKTDIGVLQPTFKILTPFGSLLGNLPELLTPPFLTLPWTVEYHKPRGFKFSVPHEYPPRPPNVGSTVAHVVEARVCGDEVYGVPWEGRHHYLENGSADFFPDRHEDFKSWIFTPGQLSTATDSPGFKFWFEGEITLGPPPTARIVAHDYLLNGPEDRVYLLPLEEDASCPESD
jgi:hypothetical protein